ncbi:hypothetical protein [Holophaga foetida]|uniref:hypothetical protein n=1 Tax=Holophaga foetida TaxID=35839 RepID=UPI00024752F0|nr:hypothetical protein [Holophaga foetida]
MNTEIEIENILDTLIGEFQDLLKLTEKTKDIAPFGEKYQNWYSQSIRLVDLLGKDRLDEFISYYRIDPKRKNYAGSTYVIQDYVNGMGASKDIYNNAKWDVHNIVAVRLMNQVHILKSLKSRLTGVLRDVRGQLLSQLEDDELRVAGKLASINLRAAGAVAGVVLEAHLQRVAVAHQINISKKNPTIADLNDPLKASGVYETATWRKIQLLSDIRNLCDHKKDRDPTKPEIEELLTGVNSIIKSVF